MFSQFEWTAAMRVWGRDADREGLILVSYWCKKRALFIRGRKRKLCDGGVVKVGLCCHFEPPSI